MKRTLRVQLGRIRNFLYSPACKKFLVFLFFVVLSTGFWMLQTLRETLEINLSVPTHLAQVPDNTTLTLPLQDHIDITLRDKGTILAQYLYRRQLKPLYMDFGKYDRGYISDRVVVPQNDVLRQLQSQLENSTRVVKLLPDTLEYYFHRGLPRRLPVKIRGRVSTLPENYLLQLTTQPDSVDVWAPTAIADTMRYAYTMPLDWEGLSETTTRSVPLLPIKGVKYSHPQVEVCAQVDYYIERTVEVPIIGLNFPADKMLRTFPSRAKVTFRVGESQSSRPWENAFVLLVTYEELIHNEAPRLRLQLKNLPPEVSHVRIHPQEVDYLIEHKTHEPND